MKVIFIFAILSLNFLYAGKSKSYEPIISESATPDDEYAMRSIQSDYEPSIEKCFKSPLTHYNVTYRMREQEWKFKESVICYTEENAKLPQDKKVNFDGCKEDLRKNEAYDIAACYQGSFVKAHNYNGY